MLVDFLFASLPAVLPEPALISGHRQGRPKFQDAVLAFSDLDLRAGLVEMQPTSNVCRQRHDTSGLNGDETMECHATMIA